MDIIQHNSLFFISDDNNHDTNFVYKIQTILVDYLKENLPTVDKIFYFSDGCAEQYKYRKKLYRFVVVISKISIWVLNGYSLQLFIASHHAMVLGDLLNVMLRKTPTLPNFELTTNAWSMCLPFITFFGVSQVNVRVDLEDYFAKWKTVPGTRSSHHFVLISCNKIAHKLASEDREFLQFDFDKSLTKKIDIKNHQVFFLYQLYIQYILVGWHSDWSKCTWRWFEDWISSSTWT